MTGLFLRAVACGGCVAAAGLTVGVLHAQWLLAGSSTAIGEPSGSHQLLQANSP